MEIWQFNENDVELLNDIQSLPKEKLIWIDATPDEVLVTFEKVESLTKLIVHERHVKDCLNLQHPCFYDSTLNYDILILRSLVSSEYKACTDTMPISFLLFNNLLVTFNSNDHAVARVKKRLESTSKKLPTDQIGLTFILLDEIVDNFLDLRGSLQDRYNYWQQTLFVGSKQQLNWIQFLNFKADIRKLRILGEDQQEVVYQWRQDNELVMNEHYAIRFNDLSDHIHRIIRYTKQLESDLDTLIELYYSLIGNRTNEVMKILTVLSAIFLPLNLIAGIFGMNFTNMHLLNTAYGADLTLIGMTVLGILLFVLFKWNKWI